MGRTLTIKYVVNVLTGDGVCCVYANETMIETFNCNLSFEVPYKLNNDFYSSTLNIDSSYLYGFTPSGQLSYTVRPLPVNQLDLADGDMINAQRDALNAALRDAQEQVRKAVR